MEGCGFGSDAGRPLFVYSSILTDCRRFSAFLYFSTFYSRSYLTCYHVNTLL